MSFTKSIRAEWLFLLLMMVVGQAQAENIATNSSFEDGLATWSQARTGSGTIESTDQWATDGLLAAYLSADQGMLPVIPGVVGLGQSLQSFNGLIDNHVLRISFDAVVDNAGGGASFFLSACGTMTGMDQH